MKIETEQILCRFHLSNFIRIVRQARRDVRRPLA